MGIIGIIYTFIFDFIHSNILKYDINFYNRIYNLIDNKKEFIFIIIVYMIFICILNILNLKVIEETRPSYLAIVKGLTNFLIRISRLIQQYYYPNKYKDLWNVINVLFDIITLLSFFIFCELITFNFCELDKYTIQKTADRGESDTINGISEIQEFDFFYHI
jgi:hypothetical protein